MKKRGLLILVFLIVICVGFNSKVNASVTLDVNHIDKLEMKTIMEHSSVSVYQDYSYIVEQGQLYLCAYSGNEEVLTIPSTINGYDVYGIYTDTFSYAPNLKKVIIPSTVNYIYDYAFVNCLQLTEIEVDSNNPVYASVDGMLYSKDYLFFVVCPGGRKGVINIDSRARYICDYAFANCIQVTGINIPSGIEEIGDYVFLDTCFLQNITVGTGNTHYTVYDDVLYTIDKRRLYKCPDRINKSIVIPNTVERIEPYAFYNCEDLQTPLNIPNSVTFIGESAFQGCRGLQTEITIPYSVETIEDKAFKYCSNLKGVVIGSGITEIPFEAFANCSSLSKIVIPNNIKKIGSSAFFNCSGVKELYISNGVETIEDHAFDWLMNLTGDVVIPDSVTLIGESAFQNSPKIDGYIVIGKNVRSVGASAFYSASKAKGIIFKGQVPECTKYSFLAPNVTYYHKEENGNFESILQSKDIEIYNEQPKITYMVGSEVLKEVTHNTYGLKIIDIPSATKEEYVFAGWYKDPKFMTPFDFDSTIMANTTLYAKFKAIPYIDIKNNVINLDLKSEEAIKLITNIEDKENIIYEVEDSTIALVDLRGNIKPLKVGTTNVKVKYDDIEKDVTINVTSSDNILEIIDDEMTVYVGNSKNINTKVNDTNKEENSKIDWTTTSQGVTVENGVVTANEVGTYVVTVSYKDLADTVTVNVVDTDTFKIIDKEIVVKEGDSYKVQIDAAFGNLTENDIVWSSSDENVALVSNGIVKADAFGTATITATLGNVTKTCKIRVVGKDHLYLSENNLTLKIGKKQYIPKLDFYAYFNSTNDIIWTSSDENVAVVEEGVVKFVGLGNVSIKGKINAEQVVLNLIIIEDDVLEFAKEKETRKVEQNAKLDLDYTLVYNGVKSGIYPVFTSSNSDVIRVENNELYMVGSGDAVITAIYNELSATINITLVPNDFISCGVMGYVLTEEDEIDLTYSYYIHEQDNVEISFTTENPNVAVIDDHGKITAKGNGETNIVMSYGDLTETIPVVVSDKNNELGDVNQDGKINGDDAALAIDMFKGIDLSMTSRILADMNLDKRINADDAAKIMDRFKEN